MRASGSSPPHRRHRAASPRRWRRVRVSRESCVGARAFCCAPPRRCRRALAHRRSARRGLGGQKLRRFRLLPLEAIREKLIVRREAVDLAAWPSSQPTRAAASLRLWRESSAGPLRGARSQSAEPVRRSGPSFAAEPHARGGGRSRRSLADAGMVAIARRSLDFVLSNERCPRFSVVREISIRCRQMPTGDC